MYKKSSVIGKKSIHRKNRKNKISRKMSIIRINLIEKII